MMMDLPGFSIYVTTLWMQNNICYCAASKHSFSLHQRCQVLVPVRLKNNTCRVWVGLITLLQTEKCSQSSTLRWLIRWLDSVLFMDASWCRLAWHEQQQPCMLFSVTFHHPVGSAVSTHSPVYVIVTGSHHFQKVTVLDFSASRHKL